MLPHRRSEIYKEALDALLRRWDKSRGIERDSIYHGLTVERKHDMFAEIAAIAFYNTTYLFEQTELEEKLFSSLLIFITHCNNTSCLLENLWSNLVVFTCLVWFINVKINAKNSWKN